MNDQIEDNAQEVLAEMLQRVLDGTDAMVEFGKDQLPAVIEQLLLWHMIESLIYFGLGIFVLIATLIGAKMFWKVNKPKMSKEEARDAYVKGEAWTRFRGSGIATSHEYDSIMNGGMDASEKVLFAFVVGTVTFIGCIITFSNLAWLKIILAPDLYLLEYAAGFIK